MQRSSPFDVGADRYDLWFESGQGRAIFEIEKTCLRTLTQACEGLWLEVGVGSGRFAAALGISDGLDPSRGMLALAVRRGLRIVCGIGEALPYRDATFDGILVATTLCFVTDAGRTLVECHRALRQRGTLVVAIVPADSAWGRLYRTKGREGHPLYSKAQFYTCEHVVHICADAGFVFQSALSCLLAPPGEDPMSTILKEGINESAGFVAMSFVKASSETLSREVSAG